MKYNIFILLSISLLLLSNSCIRSNSFKRVNLVSQNSSITIKKNPLTNDNVEFVIITNPNNLTHTGKAREKDLVDKELEACMKLSLFIEDYTKQNGIKKTIEEVNKGKDGELGSYMPDEHFYLSFSENILGDSTRTIIAHATIPSAVGFAIPDLSMIKDNTGWPYNGIMQDLLESQDVIKSGIIEELIWTDPVWSSNSCRMTAHYTLFYYNNKEYNLYYAIWLDR